MAEKTKTQFQLDHQGLSTEELREAQRQLRELEAERSGKSAFDKKIANATDDEFRTLKQSVMPD